MPILSGTFYTPAGQFISSWESRGITLEGISPGGWSRATGPVEVAAPYVGIADALPGSIVEVHDPQGLCWRGRINSPKGRIRLIGSTVTVEAHGISTHLGDRRYWVSTIFRAGTTVDAAMVQARNDLCPGISTNNHLIRPSGRGLDADSQDFIGQRAIEVFRSFAALGDQNDNPIYWHVWEGSLAPGSKPDLEVIPRPTTPDYYVSVEDGAEIDTDAPLSEMYNVALVKWGSPVGYFPVQDLESQAAPPQGYGWRRDQLVDASMLSSVVDAERAGRAYLSRVKRVSPRGEGLTIPRGTDIHDRTGATILPTRVRPGRLIRVSSLRQGAIFRGQYEFLVGGTSFNDASESLTASPETPDYLTRILARFASGGS